MEIHDFPCVNLIHYLDRSKQECASGGEISWEFRQVPSATSRVPLKAFLTQHAGKHSSKPISLSENFPQKVARVFPWCTVGNTNSFGKLRKSGT